MLLAEATATETSITSFVQSVIGGITSNITLADIGVVVAAIIGAGIVAFFCWKFARKGYRFVKNALSGKNASI